ncbi:uncharacterized protein LMH87_008672 [Akanthomyces muscarius]|uniref:Uncharacterized protein n=1 Tax=Akanthomyces muscarius TaxID=2231603 RepID=A0A9W8QJN4_AKAMU|nr:uncharacterized protein LMH87_008672 [Akanthomyces muscarius]KAJ4158132.1 hypothetical protein LMH87_008672 [Akanthomyces muscarius]
MASESSAVFKSVKKVRNFEPVGEIDDGMGKKWKVVVDPINLDPSYDMIDFSAPGARVANTVLMVDSCHCASESDILNCRRYFYRGKNEAER